MRRFLTFMYPMLSVFAAYLTEVYETNSWIFFDGLSPMDSVEVIGKMFLIFIFSFGLLLFCHYLISNES